VARSELATMNKGSQVKEFISDSDDYPMLDGMLLCSHM
jgi:hypothetical protein